MLKRFGEYCNITEIRQEKLSNTLNPNAPLQKDSSYEIQSKVFCAN